MNKPLICILHLYTAYKRCSEFIYAWFAWHCRFVNPLMYGDYPDVMKRNVGTRLPTFTNLESNQVKGSIDFLGVNYYLTVNVKDDSSKLEMELRNFDADMAVDIACMF